MDDQRTITEMNSPRKGFRVTARTGFIVAAGMFFLPLVLPLVGAGVHAVAIVSTTAA
ncbi:hypothetical protein [Curtobacterium caseinilyticum]|uniref:Uncharacterized protein n=1 Tax=Curtobacterium caseinilyticum TaxID=3055137 RepID=A0ABT7TTK5_9MICO|nr:hypothetical protein [Curtobacterium caseinilyticum]MDM7892948.1 hypothetical protein [Curtobacterium caseinilyticum]